MTHKTPTTQPVAVSLNHLSGGDAVQFGRLRSALHEPASVAAFRRVCDVLDPQRWEDAVRWRREVLPYAEVSVAQWPDDVRQMPHAWTARIMSGNHIPHFGVVATVILRRTCASLAQFTNFIESLCASGIVSLTLHNMCLSPQYLRILCTRRGFSSLKALDLRGNEVGDDGCVVWRDEADFPTLTRLNLSSNDIGSRGASALAEAAHMLRLDTLDLGENHIGDEGARYLARSPYLDGLALDLSANAIGPCGAAQLLQSEYLSKVKKST